jgi:hypothetical protein
MILLLQLLTDRSWLLLLQTFLPLTYCDRSQKLIAQPHSSIAIISQLDNKIPIAPRLILIMNSLPSEILDEVSTERRAFHTIDRGLVAVSASLCSLATQVVTKLHDDFCRCLSASSRPSVWDSQRSDREVWDAQALRQLQQEPCNLRLVNSRFFLAATRWFLSHCSLTFGASHLYSAGLRKKIKYCTNLDSKTILSSVTGVRFDMDLKEASRHLRLLDKQGQYRQRSTKITRHHMVVTKNRCDKFLRRLATLQVPLICATALEMRLPEQRLQGFSPYENLGIFVGRNMPSLTDIYFQGPAVSKCHRVCW